MNKNIEQILSSVQMNKNDKYDLIKYLKDIDERDKDLDSIHNEAIKQLNLKDKEHDNSINAIIEDYATKEYVNTAISTAITNTLNNPV